MDAPPAAKQRAANQRIVFFQREIQVAGSRRGQRGDFAAHPDVGIAAFQRFAQLADQMPHAVHFCGIGQHERVVCVSMVV